MRVRITAVAAEFEAALAQQLAAAGHDLAGDGSDGVDALVAGLGAAPPAPAAALDLDQSGWEDAVGRARAAFAAVRDLAAQLRARDAGGSIVLVVDPTALRPVEGALAWSVPGAFLTTIAQVAAAELAPHGIRVNTLVAGWTETAAAGLADGAPLARAARADEIASACAFLLSDAASYVTGSTLAADGGYSITKTAGGSPLLPSRG